MEFYCTSEFRKTLLNFLKKPKQKLNRIKEEIPKVVTYYNLKKTEWDWANRIVKGEKFTTYKVRLPNNDKGLAKSAGFRLHFAFDNTTGNVIFIGLLDKKTQKDQFSDKEYKHLLTVLQTEYEANELFAVDLSSGSLGIVEG